MAKKNTRCRVCLEPRLTPFLDFGEMPLANRLLTTDLLSEPEPKFPLQVSRCNSCGLVQLLHVVPPELMFRNYSYLTGISKTMTGHFVNLARNISSRYGLGRNSFIVDVGSNDGTLLGQFKNLGWRVLGVEPAQNVAEVAEKNGIHTVHEFFGETVVKRILAQEGRADVITCTNVFAHVDDLDSHLRSLKSLLSEDGILLIEVPYLPEMLSRSEFDTIYHEHLSYFHVAPLVKLFERHAMNLINVESLDVHGGSIRVHVSRSPSKHKVGASVNRYLKTERAVGLATLQPHLQFAEAARRIRVDLLEVLRKLRTSGKRIVGYGAAAKGNTLLNWCRIGPETLSYIVDDTPFKQGLFTPGTHVPIVPISRLKEEKADYILVLAWNWFDEIARKAGSFVREGGGFIVPIPAPKIVNQYVGVP